MEYMQSIVPHGEKCYGCPKGDPHGIEGYCGNIFCHFLEEVCLDGEKQCGINDPLLDLQEAEKRWNYVTLGNECASLQEIESAWDDLQEAKKNVK